MTETAANESAVLQEAADTVTAEELASIHEGRARLYGLLARMYRVEVDPLLLDQLRAMKFPAATGDERMDKGYRMLAAYLANVDGATLTELAIDYVRAFIGHGIDGHSAAYPFESVHVSEKRLMMQGARDEVLAVYHSEGIDKREDWREGEDHIALELEFMQTMAQRTAAALRDGNETEAERLLAVQRSFDEAHLSVWVPTFTRDMRLFAKTGFYQGLSYLTEGFLAVDRAFLAGE